MSESLLNDSIFEQVLLADKGSNARLIHWSLVEAKLVENSFNICRAVDVSYKDDDKMCNTTYVAKLNPCNGAKDEFNPYRHRAMKKEAFFYHKLLPILNRELTDMGQDGLSVPKCFYANDDKDSEVLIFEDLCKRDFEILERSKPLTKDHVEIMMKEIAKLHAASITLKSKLNGQDLVDVYPLLLESWMTEDPELSLGFARIFTKGAMFNKNLADALPEFSHMSTWLQNLAPRGMEVILKYLQAEEPWRVICHADYHRWNVMFRHDSSGKPLEIMVIDWQTVRVVPPSSEIQYLSFSSVYGPERAEFLKLSSDVYYTSLESLLAGAKTEVPYSKEEFEKDCKSNHFALFLCFFLLPLSMAVDKPEDLFDNDKGIPMDISVYKKMLEENTFLKTAIIGYLEAIEERKLRS